MESSEQTPDGSAYSVLARERRLIERVLDSLGRLCDEAHRTKQLDDRAANLAIHFLRDFADRTHHLKEERILFPAIAAQGFLPGGEGMLSNGLRAWPRSSRPSTGPAACRRRARASLARRLDATRTAWVGPRWGAPSARPGLSCSRLQRLERPSIQAANAAMNRSRKPRVSSSVSSPASSKSLDALLM